FPDGVTLSEADLPRIEERMRRHVKADEPFVRQDVGVGEALERFAREDQPYKVELIEDLIRDQGIETVSLYSNDGFTDLCRGPRAFKELVALSREMGEPRGYTEVKTPQIYDSSLWQTSGHWGKYRENMFLTEAEEHPMAVKPMNCPGHCHLFSLQQWSYRDLPV